MGSVRRLRRCDRLALGIGSSALDRGFLGIIPEDVDDDEPQGVRIGSLVDDGAAKEA